MSLTSIIRLLVCASLVAWQLTGAPPVLAQAEDAAENGALPKRTTIRFLTASEFPPFHYHDDDNVLTGFDVDMARAICLELSARCDIRVRDWDDLLPALRRGEADAVIASQVITPQALAQVDFTDRYYFTPARFAARRGTQPDISADALDGKKIGVARGTAHEAFLRAFFQSSTIEPFDTPEAARAALMAGSIDLVFGDGISLIFWLNGTTSKTCCELAGGPYLDATYFGDGIGIAVAKTDPQIKGMINHALRRVRESGRYEELMLRYFPNPLY